MTRRALIILVALLILAAAAFPLANALTSGDENDVTTRLTLERALGPTGATELIAYVRTTGGDGPLGTGDRLRLKCQDAGGRAVFGTSRRLVDDRGIYAPHLHVEVRPRLLEAIRTCRGAGGGGLTLEARLPAPLR